MTRVDLPGDPLSRLSRSVFTLNGILLRSGELVANPLGQSVARWHVLGRANSEPRSVSAIARYIGVSRQSVQRIANDLAADGLVAFRPDPADRRAPIVHVTAAGAGVLAELYARDAVLSRLLAGELDDARLVALSEALDAVSAALGGTLATIDPVQLDDHGGRES